MGVIVSFCVCVHMRAVHAPKDQCCHNEHKGRGCSEGRDGFPWRRSLRIVPVVHHEEFNSTDGFVMVGSQAVPRCCSCVNSWDWFLCTSSPKGRLE